MGLMTRVDKVTFLDPEEGTAATVDRLALSITRHWVSPSALEVLVLLTSRACRSEQDTSMHLPSDAIHELKFFGLIKQGEAGKVELI